MASSSKCVKQGYLYKKTRKAAMAAKWHWRYHVLTEDGMLQLSKGPEQSVKESLDVSSAQIRAATEKESGGKDFGFSVTVCEPPLLLRAANRDEYQEWMAAFQRVNSSGRKDTVNDAAIGTRYEEIKAKVMQLHGEMAALCKGKLVVDVVEARDLLAVHKTGSDAFCLVRYGGVETRTDVEKRTSAPQWNARFTFDMLSYSSSIDFVVHDYGRMGNGKMLGRASFDLEKLEPNVPLSLWLPLVSCFDKEVAEPGGINVTLEIQLAGVSGGSAETLSTTAALDRIRDQFMARLQEVEKEAVRHRQEKLALRREMVALFEEDYAAAGWAASKLQLGVLEARGLLPADSNGFSDPYCIVKVRKNGKAIAKFTTPIIDRTLNPVWNVSYLIDIRSSPLLDIEFLVFDHDALGSDDFLGFLSVSLEEIEFGDEPKKDMWMSLGKHRKHQASGTVTGEIRIQLTKIGQRSNGLESGHAVDEAIQMARVSKMIADERLIKAKEREDSFLQKKDQLMTSLHSMFAEDHALYVRPMIGKLHIDFGGGKLKESDNSGYFLDVSVGDGLARTNVCKVQGADEDAAGELAWFDAHDFTVTRFDETVGMGLYRYSSSGNHKLIGIAKVPLKQLKGQQIEKQLLHFTALEGGGTVADVKAKLQFLDTSSLRRLAGPKQEDTRNYGPLQELVAGGHKGVVPVFLEALDSADVDQVAGPIIRIAETRGHSLMVLQHCIHHEVEDTLTEGTLFRRNSVASRLCTAYAKHVGKEYLKTTLAPAIKKILAEEQSLEVDPSRLTEEAEAEDNLQRLEMCSALLLEAIIEGKDNCPRDLRAVVKTLQTAIAEKFPNSKHVVTGGFLFLRYFVPAITAPEGFGVVSDLPSPQGRRSLILISKVIQNLANGVEFGKKEPFMEPLNRFIQANLPRLHKYFDEVGLEPEYSPTRVARRVSVMADNDLQLIHLHIYRNLDKIRDMLSQTSSHDAETLPALEKTMSQLGAPNTDVLDFVVESDEMAPTKILERAAQVLDFQHITTQRAQALLLWHETERAELVAKYETQLKQAREGKGPVANLKRTATSQQRNSSSTTHGPCSEFTPHPFRQGFCVCNHKHR